MGDHFVLLVDRLLTESTLEAALESRNQTRQFAAPAVDETSIDCSSHMDTELVLSPRKMVECRICQDEDVDSNMETPCSCCGSLKYAHRRCVQRWCNEKGDTVCEICLQQFKPGYTAPPPAFQLGNIPLNFRGNWGIARRDLNGPRLIAMVSTDRNFVDPNYEEYEVSASRSLMCCRSIAIIFMILLLLRHTLPVVFNRAEIYSFPLLMLLLVRALGVVLPIYIILRAVTAVHRRQYQQIRDASLDLSDQVAAGPPTLQHQSQIIHVH